MPNTHCSSTVPKGSSEEKENKLPSPEVIPGAPSLLQHIDKRLYVWLRDGRMFVGRLRSVDQFANLVMYEAVERIHNGKEFGDLPQGVLMIRGENVALLGEMGDDKGRRYSANQLLAAQEARENAKNKINKLKTLAYWKRGLIFSFEDYF
ncbi:U6 snRNA-associated Sm-like protein LSm1 [Araneus ventricosus]|uniref:U6 snRNA-associated Sm-like protein LSm1 n=1 Tax=Araneus ventricosus TaxID=182803 RepID=A0A4Y2B911_ARAVE|nr:U6 snRNA-associated Sm-like protein LSm1 [Araneus ventricosus]